MKSKLLAVCIVGMVILANCGTKSIDPIDTTVVALKTLDNTVTPPAPLQEESDVCIADTTAKEA